MKLVHWIYPQLPAAELLAQLQPEDVLLLRQDACYSMALCWPALPCKQLVLETDHKARGMALTEPWQAIDDARWVELAVQATLVVLWPK